MIALRNPSLITHPQFYAEDGSVWYAEAYNQGGFAALKIPEGGYLNTLPRLVAWFSLCFPLAWAPLVMNLAGIVIQAAPAVFLVWRSSQLWGRLSFRLLLALTYLLLPNTREVHVVLTNAQFHLALLAFLVIVAAEAETAWERCLDAMVLLIFGVSGPFCLFLVPIAFFLWFDGRSSRRLNILLCLIVLSCVQAGELLSGGFSGRSSCALGATVPLFLRIVAGHVYVASFIGQNGFATRAGLGGVLLVAFAGTAVVCYAFWRAVLPLKLLLLFSALLLGASLLKPLVAGSLPQWQLLAADRGARYWFFPTLAMTWTFLWCGFFRRPQILRVVAIAGCVAMLYGVVRDFRYPAYREVHFLQAVNRFNEAGAGETVDIPVYPPGTIARLNKK